MSKSRHTEAQMIGALKQLEAGRKADDVAREVGVSKHTIYAWKAKYGGMDVSEAQEAKQLRDENTRLRKLVADLSLDKERQAWKTRNHAFPTFPQLRRLLRGLKLRNFVVLSRERKQGAGHRQAAFLYDGFGPP